VIVTDPGHVSGPLPVVSSVLHALSHSVLKQLSEKEIPIPEPSPDASIPFDDEISVWENR